MATIKALDAKKKRQEAEAAEQLSQRDTAPSASGPSGPAADEREAYGPVAKVLCGALDVINSLALQTILYLAFVIVFQLLAGAARLKQEYYVDKHVMDRIVENHFDSSHNTFNSVRRIADIYEWGNNVLWPGLLGDFGPCMPDGVVGSPRTPKTCIDEAWPDGEGSFALDTPTPYNVEELVERMDMFDWTDGIIIRQARAAAASCSSTDQLGACYPEIADGVHAHSTDSFGYNWTHPSQPPLHAWELFTADALGANPDGVKSAAIPSMMTYTSDAYVAVVIPFFSDTYLPEERGVASQVTDFRQHYVNTTNGRAARFYCVRLSPNGRHVRQLCDPGTTGNGTGALTGAVRLAIEDMWNDLKRGHFIDARTRVVTITLQLRSNPLGVRYKNTLMFELSSLGAIFPSYDVETRILDSKLAEDTRVLSAIALALVLFFTLLEGVELSKCGVVDYFSDMWNVMDWANFIVYYAAYGQLVSVWQAEQETPAHTPCTSYLCAELGYFDDWKVMSRFRLAKLLISLCICILMLKILKFLAALVPKMSLATSVLKKCLVDLAFFGICFMISVLAFSSMLSIQLGPVMYQYADQIPAFIALFRALFGDFDIDEILDNSSGYTNAILFLAYLFIAIFIMLSMFLAILAEAQVEVREDEKAAKQEWENKGGQWDEYGVLSSAWRLTQKHVCEPAKPLLQKAMGVQQPAKVDPKSESATADGAAAPEVAAEPAVAPLPVDILIKAVAALQQDVAELRMAAVQGSAVMRAAHPKLASKVATPPARTPAPLFTPLPGSDELPPAGAAPAGSHTNGSPGMAC